MMVVCFANRHKQYAANLMLPDSRKLQKEAGNALKQTVIPRFLYLLCPILHFQAAHQ